MKIVLEINEIYDACQKAIKEKAGAVADNITDDDCTFEIEDGDGNHIDLGDIQYVATVAD